MRVQRDETLSGEQLDQIDTAFATLRTAMLGQDEARGSSLQSNRGDFASVQYGFAFDNGPVGLVCDMYYGNTGQQRDLATPLQLHAVPQTAGCVARLSSVARRPTPCKIYQRWAAKTHWWHDADSSDLEDVFQTWAPRLHAEYRCCQEDYKQRCPEMQIPSNILPFAAVTANLGPKTICHKHVDAQNLSYGWCVVCAMGEFDSTMGGHMVLHDARIILEYGRGDIIFLPSAIMAHENIPVQGWRHATR